MLAGQRQYHLSAGKHEADLGWWARCRTFVASHQLCTQLDTQFVTVAVDAGRICSREAARYRPHMLLRPCMPSAVVGSPCSPAAHLRCGPVIHCLCAPRDYVCHLQQLRRVYARLYSIPTPEVSCSMSQG
jgi:hypothetical protein